jgi:hypothetical protein
MSILLQETLGVDTKITPKVFFTLLTILEQEMPQMPRDIEPKSLSIKMNERFNLSLKEEDILGYFALDIELEDVELIYKNCLI